LNSENERVRSHHLSSWFSQEREIIEPSALSENLGIDTAILCPITEFYNQIIDRLGLSDADNAPSFNGSLGGKMNGERLVYLSAVGAPSAGMLLETLIASGIRKVLMLGFAGSISAKCRIGDLAIPTWGIREEGTSYHYLEPGMRPEASIEFVQKLRNSLRDAKFVEGGVWTTDAPYRETISKVRDYAEVGAIAVEMECTALMSIAMYRKVDFASLLVITDEIFEGEWKQGFDSSPVEDSIRIVCDAMRTEF
jgi:uridine phosphorylase